MILTILSKIIIQQYNPHKKKIFYFIIYVYKIKTSCDFHRKSTKMTRVIIK